MQVYADTSHLVQSAVDGYNVCIFAYGQTGSGKTFTIYGTEEDPGVTPRAIHELFNIVARDSGKYSFSISCYMLELYQDDLADLLLAQTKDQRSNKASAGQGIFSKSVPDKVRVLCFVLGIVCFSEGTRTHAYAEHLIGGIQGFPTVCMRIRTCHNSQTCLCLGMGMPVVARLTHTQ